MYAGYYDHFCIVPQLICQTKELSKVESVEKYKPRVIGHLDVGHAKLICPALNTFLVLILFSFFLIFINIKSASSNGAYGPQLKKIHKKTRVQPVSLATRDVAINMCEVLMNYECLL